MSMNEFRQMAAKIDQHMQQLFAQGVNNAQLSFVSLMPLDCPQVPIVMEAAGTDTKFHG
jgi:hypothetical protein